MDKLPTGEALKKLCKELGVDLTVEPRDGVGGPMPASDSELQRRLIETIRHNRERYSLVVAVVSALIAVAGAIAAWIPKFTIK